MIDGFRLSSGRGFTTLEGKQCDGRLCCCRAGGLEYAQSSVGICRGGSIKLGGHVGCVCLDVNCLLRWLYLPPVVPRLCRPLHEQTLSLLATARQGRRRSQEEQCGRSCRPETTVASAFPTGGQDACTSCSACLNRSWANIGMILCSIVSAAEQLSPQTIDGYRCTARVTSLSTVASSRSFPAPHILVMTQLLRSQQGPARSHQF